MFELNVNGQSHNVDVPADMPVLWVLRDLLGMTGTKFGCGIAQCGACTVHADGDPVRSCLLTVADATGRQITTIEAIGGTPRGSTVRWCSAATARVARSCPPRPCSSVWPSRPTPT
jgi:isoquinoline 1-oxidoreductase alpha subunit